MADGIKAFAIDARIMPSNGSLCIENSIIGSEKKERRLRESDDIKQLMVGYTSKEAVKYIEDEVLIDNGDYCLWGGSGSREVISSQGGLQILQSSKGSSKADIDLVVCTEKQVIAVEENLGKRNGRYSISSGEVGGVKIEFIDGRRIWKDAFKLVKELLEHTDKPSRELQFIMDSLVVEGESGLQPDYMFGYSISGLGPFHTSSIVMRKEDNEIIYELLDPQSQSNALYPFDAQREFFTQGELDAVIYTGNDEGSVLYQLVELVNREGLYEDISPQFLDAMELILRIPMEHATGRYTYAVDSISYVVLKEVMKLSDLEEFSILGTKEPASIGAFTVFSEYVSFLDRLIKEGGGVSSQPIQREMQKFGIESVESHIKKRINKNFAETCSVNPEIALFYNFIYMNLSSVISPIVSESIKGLFTKDGIPINNSMHKYIWADGNIEGLNDMFSGLEKEMEFVSRLKKACSYLYPIGEFGRPEKTPKSINEIFAILYYAVGYTGEGDLLEEDIMTDLKNWNESGRTKKKLKKKDARMDKMLDSRSVIEGIRGLSTHLK